MGIQKRFSRIIFIKRCNYSSMASIQSVHYVKINVFSTYLSEMSIKCLKKYLSRKLLKCYFIGAYNYRVRFYFIEYNYMFHAPQERKDEFATINKIKCLKTLVLV